MLAYAVEFVKLNWDKMIAGQKPIVGDRVGQPSSLYVGNVIPLTDMSGYPQSDMVRVQFDNGQQEDCSTSDLVFVP